MVVTRQKECFGSGFLIAMSLLLAACSSNNDDLRASEHQYSSSSETNGCVGEPRGIAGRTDGFRYAEKRFANVIAPMNYKAERAHPLVVVYAPAGFSANHSERLHRFTSLATQLGYIIAYASNPGLNMDLIEDLHRLPEFLTESWCIDKSRMFVAGHSDGGTTAVASVLMGGGILRPAGIAASAFGFSRKDLDSFSCPSPVSMLLFQNRGDELFPNYVEVAADWLTQCAHCRLQQSEADGLCSRRSSCSEDIEIVFCENPGRHFHSPLKAKVLMDFFDRL